MSSTHPGGLKATKVPSPPSMKIVTDSAADLPIEELEAYGIEVAPLSIHFPEGEIKSNEISPDEFYDRLRAMVPKLPTTSQPSAGFFSRLYQRIASAGDEILSVHISSGLSGTIGAARMGAEHVRDILITPIDTLTLSGGQRFQVLAAALAVRAGWTKQAIQDRLEQIRAQTEVIYTLETLDYLARGGRIGRVQALAGSLLHLKPIINVDKKDGKYNTVGKERTINKALKKIVDHLVNQYGVETPLWVTVLHGQFQEQADLLAEMLRERLPVAKLEILRISPVLGVHTGPGIVGAAVVPFKMMEGIG